MRFRLRVVATDLYARSERVFTAGPLKPPIAASLAVPGLLQPVLIDGRVLVDGAALNPLPFDRLRGCADVIVAVDSSVGPTEARGVPHPWEAMFATMQVMGHAIVSEKLKQGAPDLVIRPNVGSFPPARLHARERHPARGRAGEGGGEGAAGGLARYQRRARKKSLSKSAASASPMPP